jgi:hypothetical protein
METTEIPAETSVVEKSALTEVPKKQLSTELTFNVLEGPTGEVLNDAPLTLEAAQKLANQLHESTPGRALLIRSNPAILQE